MVAEHRTVAVIAGEDRRSTGEVLDLLGRCLADGDSVVVAGPETALGESPWGSSGTPAGAGTWHVRREGRMVRAETAPGWAPVVVVLDCRAAPVGSWLAPLQQALADRSVGAAAPRTNAAAGGELLVGVPYRPDEGAVRRAFVEQRATDPTLTDVSLLDGPCLAVRRADFESVRGARILAGPAPVATLARRIAARGRRLVVAEGSYLHMAGGRDPRPVPDAAAPAGGPLVTACLIVKNERENLPRCLRSLEELCDAVVVYDTGSSDRTPALARSHGATVVDGYWDADFSRARNAALAHCRGQWVLWVDADEELVCADRPAARRALAEMPASTEALIVLVDNVRGTRAATSLAHPACRLFRRACGHWTGRIHEQVRARRGSPELRTRLAHDVRITHWGYLRSTVEQRAKGERNVRSAFSDLAGVASLPWAARLVSLARSYGLRGQPEEAVDLCQAALAAAGEPHVRRLAERTLVDSLLALGDPQAALDGVAALRRAQEAWAVPADCSAGVAVAEGRAYLALGRPADALTAFEQVAPGLDEDGFDVGPHDLAADKARALGQLGRFGEAADLLLAGIRATGGMDAPVAMLLECLEGAGRSPHELAAAVPAERQVAFLGQLVNAEPGLADRALEAWHEAAPSLAVLATAATVASSLPLPRRIVWSARLREHDLAGACPLVATVGDVTRTVPERLLAAALAVQLWGDPRGRQAVTALVSMLAAAERSAVCAQVSTIAPAVALVTRAVAPTPAALVRRGARTGPGRTVLVVDRRPASLRSMAVAVALRRAGHRVAVSWPGPAPATEERLATFGIPVHLWDAGDAGDWQEACRRAIAQAAAEEPHDVVVLAAPVLEMAATVRSLLPRAQLVADLDDRPLGTGDAAGADLLFTADPEPPARRPGGTPVVTVGASADELFGPAPPTPWAVRQGLVVVGDFADAGDVELERWHRTLAPFLHRRLAGHPAVVIGDDPEGFAPRALPGALHLGASVDPVSWLRAARVALVATTAGARHWRAVAALAGTPVLCAPPRTLPDGAAEHELADLADTAASIVRAAAAPSPPAPAATGTPAAPWWTRTAGPDPLARLRPPRAERARVAPPGGAPVSWAGTSPLRDQLRGRAPSAGTGLGVGTGTGGGEPGGAVLEIRGGTAPDLSPRRAARVVVELRWGYANVPVEWVGPLRDIADELWVPGPWLGRVLRAAGVTQAVHAVPPGVDVTRFAPGREPYALCTDRSVRFLFVGDCDEASGADALLEAYFMAFTDDDDVCLVVRPTGQPERRTFEADLRRAAAGAPGRPAVEVVDPDLGPGDVAALYRACDVLVHPHRAAGSPEVVLEAMASGRPVVTLDDGAAADVCDRHTGWLVPCRTVRAAPPRGLLVAGELLQLEPRRAALAAALQDVAASADRVLVKGLAARDRAVSRHALDVAAATVAARIGDLCAPWAAGHGGVGEAPPAMPAAG